MEKKKFFFWKFSDHKNTPKLMILELPQPQDYYRTIRDIEIHIPSPGVVRFHGLGPDLWKILGHENMFLLSWSSYDHHDHMIIMTIWSSWCASQTSGTQDAHHVFNCIFGLNWMEHMMCVIVFRNTRRTSCVQLHFWIELNGTHDVRHSLQERKTHIMCSIAFLDWIEWNTWCAS